MGLGWSRGAPPPDDLTPVDEVAQLTVAPDAALDAIRERYRDDPRFTMPGTVFNARSPSISGDWRCTLFGPTPQQLHG